MRGSMTALTRPAKKAPQFAPMLAQSAVTRELAATPMVEAAPVQMTEGSSFSAYTLSEPVSLASGQMLSLPFLQEQAATERLTLYRGGSHAPHPMMALDVTNPLPLRLPAGVVTVYDAQRGHAGDAMMPELAPKDSALVEFAEDSAIRIREDLAEQARITEARIRDGVLIASERTERTTSYRAEGAEDGARVLTLLHPQRPGWDMQTEGGTSALDATRFTVDLPQGQITQFKVIETRTSRTQLALLDLSRDDLAYWEGRMPDAETRAFFADLRDLRQQQAALRTRIAEKPAAPKKTLIADQDRLARLVDQLGDLRAMRTLTVWARIDAIDAEIDSVRQERATLETQLRASEERMGALLR